MELIYKGAEANLYADGETLIKERVVKAYRHPKLDKSLRKTRTRREAKNLKKAADAGVPVPKVFDVDERSFILKMERLAGALVKDRFEQGIEIQETSKQIGQILRRLHDAGIVHNDLTTSNLIWVAGTVHMIDFGLSYHTKRIEDRAMDLVVFKKSIEATHNSDSKAIWDALLAGYGPDAQTLSRVATIESRVRYK